MIPIAGKNEMREMRYFIKFPNTNFPGLIWDRTQHENRFSCSQFFECAKADNKDTLDKYLL